MADSAAGEPIQDALRPRLPNGTDLRHAMLRHGIDSSRFSDPQVVLLRPRILQPLLDLSKQAADFEWNRSLEVDTFFDKAAAHGTLNFHRSLNLRLPEFDAASPFGPERTTTWLSAHFSPAGSFSRARFTSSLAATDAATMMEGGWMVPLGQEDALRPLLQTYRRLPARRFQTIAQSQSESESPVTVRTAQDEFGTYCYFVNNGPWSVDLTLDLDVPLRCPVEFLDQSAPPQLADAGTHRQLNVKLAAYDLKAVRFVQHSARVLDWRVSFPPAAETGLREALQEVNLRRIELADPKPMQALENPGFEQPARDGDIPGWQFSQLPGVHVAAQRDPQSGRNALHFAVTDPGSKGWVRSDEFPLPATGRISVKALIRIPDPQQQPTVRMAIDILSTGKQSTYIPAHLGNGGDVPLPETWPEPEKGIVFHIPDLAVDGPATVTVVFEIIGEGEMWIDDVEVFDLFFNDREQGALERDFIVAKDWLREGKFAECQQYLEGFWPNFLLQFVAPPTEPRLARQPAEKTVPAPVDTPPTDEEKKRPSWSRFVPQLPLPTFRR